MGAKRYLKENNIHFQPGLNEDLAATAVWGSQQVNLFPGANVDGVFAIWYGKGPGVDRSMDVLKHGNAAGTSPHGGVIALAGDDHGCQSSTLPHQSEQVFAAAMIPVVNPANVQEYLDFGILGFALSRYSGCWIGFKAISETVESGASVWVDPERIKIVMPTDFQLPPGGLGIRNPDPPLEAEKRLHGPKMAAVKAFVRANGFDKTVIDPPRARIGIMTTGKAYLDTRQALEDLGIDRRARPRARHPPLQGRHDLAAGAGRRAALRRGPAGSDRGRGEALQPRGPARPHCSTTCRPTAARWSSARPTRPAASSCRAKAS